MAITAVGSLAHSAGIDTLAVDPVTEGDLLVVAIGLTLADDVAGAVSTVTGGGVSTWYPMATSSPAPETGDIELWWGVVETTGSSTITVTTTVGTATVVGIGAQEFAPPEGFGWAFDVNGQSASVDPAAAGIYPPVVPSWVFELYVGAGIFIGGGPGGSESGFVYESFASLLQYVYALNVSNPDQLAPPWTATEGYWAACAGLLLAIAPAIEGETIYHDYGDPDTEIPTGTVEFVLSGQLDGAEQSQTVTTRPIICTLTAGRLLRQLVPNMNSDLSPNGTYYTVTEKLAGTTPVTYPITVPTGGPFDLWTLRQQS